MCIVRERRPAGFLDMKCAQNLVPQSQQLSASGFIDLHLCYSYAMFQAAAAYALPTLCGQFDCASRERCEVFLTSTILFTPPELHKTGTI